MPTLIVTVDLQCCRCSTKIQKILCCIQDRGEFPIEKIVYEKDTVLVSGPFDAEKLYCKLWCKAGKIIKDIQVAKPPPPPPPKPKPKPKSKPEPTPSCKLVPYPCPYPCPYPQQYCPTWQCGCPAPHCECRSKPPSPPPPPQPKPTVCGCPPWSSCHCSSFAYPSYPPMATPYPPLVVCEEGAAYGACAIM